MKDLKKLVSNVVSIKPHETIEKNKKKGIGSMPPFNVNEIPKKAVAQDKPKIVAQTKPKAVAQVPKVAQDRPQIVAQTKPKQVAQPKPKATFPTKPKPYNQPLEYDMDKLKEQIFLVQGIERRKQFCHDIGFGVSVEKRGKQNYLFGIKKIMGKKYKLYIGNVKAI